MTEEKNDKQQEKSIADMILENEDPRTGKPWYVRYKHVLLLIGIWLAFGVVFAIWPD